MGFQRAVRTRALVTAGLAGAVLLLASCGGGGEASETVTVTETGSAGAATTDLSESSSSETFGDGTYVVGDDISAGTYRAPGATEGCYWARLSSFTGDLDAIIANNNESGPAVVTILPADAGFETSGCGEWIPTTGSNSETESGGLDLRDEWPATVVASWRDGCLSAESELPRRVMELGCDCMMRELQKNHSPIEVLEPGFSDSPAMKRITQTCIAEVLARVK